MRLNNADLSSLNSRESLQFLGMNNQLTMIFHKFPHLKREIAKELKELKAHFRKAKRVKSRAIES